MVTFKKEKANNIRSSINKYLATFLSGFFISLFLLVYILMRIVGGSKVEPTPSSSSEHSSSEPSSSDTSSSSSSSNPYIEEKAIIANLVDITHSYDPSFNKVINISYSSNYLYVIGLTSSNKINIYQGEIDTDIDLKLEDLITSKDNFMITSKVDSFSLSNIPSIDVTSIDTFKNDTRFSNYTYKCKNNYYIDNELDEVGISTIGYKDNSYISIVNIIYSLSTESINDTDSYISTTSNPNSEYYKLLDYLYNI